MISLIPLDTNKKLNISFAIIELIIIISVPHGTRHFIWNICMHGHISWKFEIKFQAFKQSSLYMKTCQCGLHLSLCILTIVNFLVWMKSLQVGIDLYSFDILNNNFYSLFFIYISFSFISVWLHGNSISNIVEKI